MMYIALLILSFLIPLILLNLFTKDNESNDEWLDRQW